MRSVELVEAKRCLIFVWRQSPKELKVCFVALSVSREDRFGREEAGNIGGISEEENVLLGF
jgi:hypothetical protein